MTQKQKEKKRKEEKTKEKKKTKKTKEKTKEKEKTKKTKEKTKSIQAAYCSIRILRVFGVRGNRFNVVDVARRIHHFSDQRKGPVRNRVANKQAVWQGWVAEKHLAWRAAVSAIRAAARTPALAV